MRIARRARLKRDPLADRFFLLYPEGGLLLSRTAHEALCLIAENRAFSEVLETLTKRYPEVPRTLLERDLGELTTDLIRRKLIEPDEGAA
jgi:hypothetical protein